MYSTWRLLIKWDTHVIPPTGVVMYNYLLIHHNIYYILALFVMNKIHPYRARIPKNTFTNPSFMTFLHPHRMYKAPSAPMPARGLLGVERGRKSALWSPSYGPKRAFSSSSMSSSVWASLSLAERLMSMFLFTTRRLVSAHRGNGWRMIKDWLKSIPCIGRGFVWIS